MSNDSLSEIKEAIIGDACFLNTIDPITRTEIVDHLNSRLFSHIGTTDAFYLLLVMLEIRPACIVSVMLPALSEETARRVARNPDALSVCDLTGQFLKQYGIPFALGTRYHEGRANEPAQLYLNYHISFDEERLANYEQRHLDGKVKHDELSREEDRETGSFLAYPEAAVEAFCDPDRVSNDHLLDTLTSEEIQTELGPMRELYEFFDVDYAGFIQYLLPYVVPVTASECLSDALKHANQYIFAGILVKELYGVTTFDQLVVDYRDRFVSLE